MSDDPIQDLVIGTASAIIAAHARPAFHVIMGIWYCAFGYNWDMSIDKIQIDHLRNLGEFRNELAHEVNAISPENIQSPKTSIVGPALEASKYYMDEGEIRQMFARLIATSMDKSRSDKTHHAFVDIIKMLSPLDAKNLYYLYTLKDETICNQVIRIAESGAYAIHRGNVWLGNPEKPEHNQQQVSIDNLVRLGLISVSYDRSISTDSFYERHMSDEGYTKFANEVQALADARKNELDILLDHEIPLADEDGNVIDEALRQQLIEGFKTESTWQPDIQRGIITLTAFGANLCEVCLPTM